MLDKICKFLSFWAAASRLLRAIASALRGACAATASAFSLRNGATNASILFSVSWTLALAAAKSKASSRSSADISSPRSKAFCTSAFAILLTSIIFAATLGAVCLSFSTFVFCSCISFTASTTAGVGLAPSAVVIFAALTVGALTVGALTVGAPVGSPVSASVEATG